MQRVPLMRFDFSIADLQSQGAPDQAMQRDSSAANYEAQTRESLNFSQRATFGTHRQDGLSSRDGG